jgi:hypothetical protein
VRHRFSQKTNGRICFVCFFTLLNFGTKNSGRKKYTQRISQIAVLTDNEPKIALAQYLPNAKFGYSHLSNKRGAHAYRF